MRNRCWWRSEIIAKYANVKTLSNTETLIFVNADEGYGWEVVVTGIEMRGIITSGTSWLLLER